MINLKEFLNTNTGGFAPLIKEHRDKKNISAFGLHFADKTMLAALLQPCIYVCADYVTAAKAYEQFCCFSGGAVLLPAKDDTLVYRKNRSGETAHKRLSALKIIVEGKAEIIITTVEALTQLYPDREQFISHMLVFEKNRDYDLEEVVSAFTAAGYKRETQVSAKGQFSLRGDILDFWTPDDIRGTRLEFFGDTLEEIKSFDIGEQTAVAALEKLTVCPATEIFISAPDAEDLIKRLPAEFNITDENRARAENVLSELTLSLLGGGGDELSFIMPLVKHTNFCGFIKPQTVFFDEAKAASDYLNVLYTEHENRYKALFLRGDALKCSFNQLIEKRSAFDFDCPKIAFHSLDSANRIFSPDAVFNYKSFPLPSYTRNYEGLADDINAWLSRDYRIVLFCSSEPVRQNFMRLLSEQRVGANTGGTGKLELNTDKLDFGAVLHGDNTVLIGTYNLINKPVRKALKRAKSDVFIEPAVGDYVVHNIHGIGFCETVARLEMNGASRDYFVVSYYGGDKLYVPIENMDSLTKFVAGGENPKLNKIGGADFAKAKERVKKAVKEMAFGLLDLYAKRENARGHAYSSDGAFFDEFCQSFEFEETDDQLDAVNDGVADLINGRIMDRLLCGDVGYGKTEVALRLAFKVIIEGKQAALIAPTTILARQHFATVKKRMESFGVRIGSLTRFDSDKDIVSTVQKLKTGEIDMVVGTHRVLSKDVEFKDLGLLILDEEQRFGVEDKEKIKTLKNNVNVLALSATPIPRSLHMSMAGIRDISVLDTPPAMRIPIQTYVTELTDSLIIDSVTREINRGGQVFIVYNRVETIERFAARVRSLLPDLKITLAHGQMAEGKLERVIASFVDGECDVLLATTIIENGIDMPRANTMIVVDSDRFGLSQLYQLRGRVGRSDKLAYVYFTFDAQKQLTDNAYKRLEAITEYTEFGSGFKIAMRDLEIRGAGNILGREQHGHIEKIGYDAYRKLLEDAVKEMSGAVQNTLEREVKVNTDFNAFIPENYIADREWRIRAYSRISRIASNAERLKLKSDLEEIYGTLPASADNLMLIAMVKNLAAGINAASVTLKKTECAVNFTKTHDIPAAAVALAGSRLKPLMSTVVFGTDRSSMISFLVNCNKKSF